MNMIPTMLEVARHELDVILRTRRAVVLVALYFGLAVLGGAIYVMVLRFAEREALELFMSQGSSEAIARQNMESAALEGYRKITAWLAGVDEISAIASSWRDSVILPVFFWCSLAFLPFVIMLTSFDQISADLQSRSLCYNILRARRSAILLGKALAHTVVFTVLSAVCSVLLVLLASLMLDTVSLGDSLWGLFRLWLLLIPFGLCYLGISTFASSLNRQPMPALVSAVAIVIGLWVLSLFRFVPSSSSWSFLQHLRFASPATYESGLWLAGFADPAASAAAYLGFGAVFVGLAMLRLYTRDL